MFFSDITSPFRGNVTLFTKTKLLYSEEDIFILLKRGHFYFAVTQMRQVYFSNNPQHAKIEHEKKEDGMDAIECITTRRSIRKFKPEAVPQELLKKVITAAQKSPSYKNSQPWEAVIVSGKKKDDLTQILAGLLESDAKPEPDIPEPPVWPAAIAQRIDDTFKTKGGKMGIDLNDPVIKKKAKLANFRFYGAPHGIFVFQDRSLAEWSMFDAGLFCQNIMLAAWASGLGTVPQAFLIDYSPAIRNFLGIPATKKLVLGLSIGYPELDHPANSFITGRENTDAILRFVE
ncbi:MAG: nitroreductase [Nitrospirae bacterium]|nr:MAG: nitroreductase [Nitrospirota bacterium]